LSRYRNTHVHGHTYEDTRIQKTIGTKGVERGKKERKEQKNEKGKRQIKGEKGKKERGGRMGFGGYRSVCTEEGRRVGG